MLLHHEVEVDFPDDQVTEKHRATLLEFGRIQNGKTTTAMALTVGLPAAIGALVFCCILKSLSFSYYINALRIRMLMVWYCSSYLKTRSRQEGCCDLLNLKYTFQVTIICFFLLSLSLFLL